MQCFDVLVLTTHVETFGLVLVEAMMLGIPVIGSNAGGVLEIIDHEKTGLLFKTKDAHSLAEAIERMVRDPELRQQLAAAGREKAGKAYDTETQNRKVLSLMYETCGIKR
jgi:glycosyltransferase involved in cell wall biosynthesis